MSKIIFIRLTTRCNAFCKMCSVWKRKPVNFKYNELIDLIKLFNKQGYTKIIFTGGEPTLYPSFKKLNQFLFKNNIEFGLITNGSVIHEKWDDLFKYKLPSGIIFSLDSNDAYHSNNRGIDNLTNKVILSIKKAQLEQIKTSVNTVLTNQNYIKVKALSKLSVIKKLDEWHWIPVKFNSNLSLNKNQWAELKEIYVNLKLDNIISTFNFKENINYDNLAVENYTSKYYLKNNCNICSKMIFVDLDGKIYRCNSFDNCKDNLILFGNFNENNFNNIFVKIKKNIVLKNPNCRNCDPRNQLYNQKGVLFENWFN